MKKQVGKKKCGKTYTINQKRLFLVGGVIIFVVWFVLICVFHVFCTECLLSLQQKWNLLKDDCSPQFSHSLLLLKIRQLVLQDSNKNDNNNDGVDSQYLMSS